MTKKMGSCALRRSSALAAVALVAALVIAVPSAAAPKKELPAGEAEPVASGQAWYWETQQIREVQDPVGNTHTIAGPNPFCPSAPGDLGAAPGACAPGRLPVEVQAGDYETPDKVSAISFDFSLVPLGSKISKFEVTFLEAEGGCYETEGTPPQRCERTDAINAAGHQLQACQINDFFGSGAARPYAEIPKFECKDSDPVAERKEGQVKGVDEPQGGEDSVENTWTFDLTPLAKQWATGTKQTSILLVPKAPEGAGGDQPAPDETWRVVLTGPEVKQGIVTSLKYTAPATPLPPPPTGTGGGETGVDTPIDTGFGSGTSDFGDTGTDTSDFGDTGTDTPTTDTPADDTATETGDQAPVVAEGPSGGPESFPAYMWLAILAGLVGFSMVRSIVIEKTTGVRPNGVLAQIKSLNAAHAGGPVDATTTASSGTLGAALGSVGQGFSSFAGKLKSIFKRG